MNRAIYKLYLFVRELKDLLLQTVFGFTTTCSHNPSCSTQMIYDIKKKGLIPGFFSGLKRILGCFGKKN